MRFNSLAFRLFATTAAWTLLVLPIAGIIIFSLYRQEVEFNFNERIKTLLTVVLADSIDPAGLEPKTPKEQGEALFNIVHSGWYWQIRPLAGATGPRRVSGSLASATLPSLLERSTKPDAQGYRWLDTEGPLGQPIRLSELIYTMGDEAEGASYAFTVAGPIDWLEARLSGFRRRLFTALAITGLGLVAATLLQVRFGLSPLRSLERGLASVRSGASRRLEGQFPAEIEPLASELNQLISSNEEIIERARTQVGNLAHALKTPLAVITNEAGSSHDAFAPKVAEQATIMGEQIRHYLERARRVAGIRAIGLVTEVSPVASSLKRVLERVNRDKGLVIDLVCPPEARFSGEKQDLEEMLGNLAENACKWAHQKVVVSIAIEEPRSRAMVRRLDISVDDDGPGVSPEQLKHLGRRGVRLDETKPGTGLGLSIVQDLAQTYRGTLVLSRSQHGGLCARLNLPSA